MTGEEFKKRLEKLREVITRGLAYRTVWKTLRFYEEGEVLWSLEEQNAILGHFRGFFTPVGFALLDMSLLEFAKVFDKHPRTASLHNLLKGARDDPNLVPGATAGQLDEVDKKLLHFEKVLKTLKKMRDKQLAHIDANPPPIDPLLVSELDQLAEAVKSAFNSLSSAYDGTYYGWEFSLRQSKSATTATLRILRDERERDKEKFEQEMLRIGREQIQRVEGLMERRLRPEEIRGVLQGYGLSDGQLRTIEDECLLS